MGKRRRFWFLFVGWVLCLAQMPAGWANNQSSGPGPGARDATSRAAWQRVHMALPMASAISVRGISGNLTVRHDPQLRDQVRVEFRKLPPAGDAIDAGGDRGDNEWQLHAEVSEQRLEVFVAGPLERSEWDRAERDQTLPRFDVVITTHSRPIDISWREGRLNLGPWRADTSVRWLKGQVELNQVQAKFLKIFVTDAQLLLTQITGENLHIEQARGSLSLKNSSGGLTLVTLAPTVKVQSWAGTVDFKAFAGSHHFQDIKGRLSCELEQGEVRIDAHAQDLRVKTQEAQIAASLMAGARADLRSKNGNVSIKWPNSGAYVDVGSKEGVLYVPNSLKLERTPDYQLRRGQMPGASQGRLLVRTESSNITLRQ